MGWEGPMTQRQFHAWQDWLDQDMEVPSRADFYVMQLQEQVAHVLATDFSKWNPNRHKITFKKETPRSVPKNGEPALPPVTSAQPNRPRMSAVAFEKARKAEMEGKPIEPAKPMDINEKSRQYAMDLIGALGGVAAVRGAEKLTNRG